MMKRSSVLQQPWLVLLMFVVVAGCTFDQSTELSTACVTDDDCTQGRVCLAQVCQNPVDLVDASDSTLR